MKKSKKKIGKTKIKNVVKKIKKETKKIKKELNKAVKNIDKFNPMDDLDLNIEMDEFKLNTNCDI